MSKQPWYISHAETITQGVLGQLLAIATLWWFEVPASTGWKLQTTFVVLAYARGYLVRRFFNWLSIRRTLS